jgi:hypothetical protein
LETLADNTECDLTRNARPRLARVEPDQDAARREHARDRGTQRIREWDRERVRVAADAVGSEPQHGA